MRNTRIYKDQKEGTEKLVEAVIEQAFLDIKKNWKKKDAFEFLLNYQSFFYNDILEISKNEMQILISQKSIHSKRKSRKKSKGE